MTVAQAKENQTYRIVEVRTEEAILQRLRALGILEGTRLEILNHNSKGTTIIKVRGTRWAMGKDIAGGVLIKEDDNGRN